MFVFCGALTLRIQLFWEVIIRTLALTHGHVGLVCRIWDGCLRSGTSCQASTFLETGANRGGGNWVYPSLGP